MAHQTRSDWHVQRGNRLTGNRGNRLFETVRRKPDPAKRKKWLELNPGEGVTSRQGVRAWRAPDKPAEESTPTNPSG